jgi:hypothetical protein
MCDTYDEVLADINTKDVRDCQTLIVDTGGSFVTFLEDWAIRKTPKNGRPGSSAPSQQGWGVVKSEFSRFTSTMRDVLNKNIVYVFHSDEKADGDITKQRLQCDGSARTIVWQPCDLGGFIHMLGGKRCIEFTPDEGFFAKGCYGIEGRREIPALGPNDKNDFLTRLFAEARKNIADELAVFAPEKEKYEAVMAEIAAIVDGVKTVEEANAAVAAIQGLDHALTSKKEASALLKTKVTSLGLAWSKSENSYKPKEAKEKKES